LPNQDLVEASLVARGNPLSDARIGSAASRRTSMSHNPRDVVDSNHRRIKSASSFARIVSIPDTARCVFDFL